MKSKKAERISRACAAALLCVSLCGCSVKVGTNKKYKEPAADKVVAEPKGGDGTSDMNITYGMFSKEYKYYLVNSEVEDDTAEEVADACKSLRSNTITYLINEQIIVAKAREMGLYEMSDEEQAAIDKEYEDVVRKQELALGEKALGELDAENSGSEETSYSDEEKQEKGAEKLDEILKKSGMTRDDLYWWSVSSKITEKLRAKLDSEVDYSEAEEQFAKVQKDAEEVYKESPAEFAQSSMEQVWLPAGSRNIKHILLAFDDEVKNEINSLRKEGKDDEAEKYRAEQAKAFDEKAAEIEQKLQDGATFDAMIKEYSSDKSGAQHYPDGFTVFPDGGTYMKEFQAASFVPQKIGDRTTCVTDYGLHIMEYSSDAKLSEEAVKSFKDYLYEQLTQIHFSDKMKEWADEYDYEIDYDALRLDSPEESSEAG